MDEDDKKINLPPVSEQKETKTIKIGSSEFSINPPGSAEEVMAKESVETLEKALKEKVFAELKNDDDEGN